ncbi:MAG: sugar phosphate isomerase/epimerase [Kordiimonadaceae bacterium]|nr:sugar phosphate isomerase/epimerase [Kordiimonadaceae bacterium]
MDRRKFIKTAAGASLASMAGMTGLMNSAASSGKISNYGVQLYTVRHLIAENMPRTIEQIAQMGFKEVEAIINLGGTAKEFRNALDQNGLKCVSRHMDPIQLELETLKSFIDDAHTIGQEYLILGWIPPEDRVRLDQYKSLVEKMNVASHMCKDAGIQFGYHHHDFEFVELDGELPYKILFGQTDPELTKIEMDFYWITYAGVDPFMLFDLYPGRFPMCHLKDMDKNRWFADVGKGTVDFERYLSRISQAGFKHFFVEHDEPEDPLATIRYGLESMKKLTINGI